MHRFNIVNIFYTLELRTIIHTLYAQTLYIINSTSAFPKTGAKFEFFRLNKQLHKNQQTSFHKFEGCCYR